MVQYSRKASHSWVQAIPVTIFGSTLHFKSQIYVNTVKNYRALKIRFSIVYYK
jgi:hypothetical protein